MRARALRTPSRWLSIADVAQELGVSPKTALRLVRGGTVRGGEMLYPYEGRKGERWHVGREVFEAWLSRRTPQRVG